MPQKRAQIFRKFDDPDFGEWNLIVAVMRRIDAVRASGVEALQSRAIHLALSPTYVGPKKSCQIADTPALVNAIYRRISPYRLPPSSNLTEGTSTLPR